MASAKAGGFESLVALALDMRSAWNHAADKLWMRLDPKLWGLTHNPWAVLQTVSRERLNRILEEPGFRATVDELAQRRQDDMQAPAWFQNSYPAAELQRVAYFSMEFMLGEALPIYSGGLGNVAGDQLKAAGDLGVPVVGIGLLYSQGYFRQTIDQDGAQQALYPFNDTGQLPVTPLRHPNGEWLRLELDLPGQSVWLRAWQVQVGRAHLYLLDSNDAANYPAHRGITSELYGGNVELRLQQELVLGIGGWRLLEALGLQPEVCHLNEGHAAFAVLERARSFMGRNSQPFNVALCVTRAGNLFTTHTAVEAGFDRFPPALIAQYLGRYAERDLGIALPSLLALGRADPGDESEPFNMAHLAVHGSGSVNGVSRQHGRVSRRLFAPLFVRWPWEESPVGFVTNGIHVPTWDSAPADELWTDHCGKARWMGPTDTLERAVDCVPDSSLWELRNRSRASLVEFARERLAHQMSAYGSSAQVIEAASRVFDPQALTLGFARRFAAYKRPNLLLTDPDRLLRIVSNPQRSVQLIIAGKAHPADREGQALIQRWVQFIRRPEVRSHIIFLSDYDMLLTEHLVQGVDVWINTPRPPWEACGTSGMKILVNGGLNLSVLDGWWAEAYSPEVGWALGTGTDEPTDDSSAEAATDAYDATALYDLLEHKVIPEFYQRDETGLPRRWIARMRASMSRLTPTFSSNRTVREYTERHYLPAARVYRERARDSGAAGRGICDWRERMERTWEFLKIGFLRADAQGGNCRMRVDIYLGDLSPQSVRVQLYAAAAKPGGDAQCLEMQISDERPDAGFDSVYLAAIPATRPAGDYTVRLIPQYPGVAVPLECGKILWQH